MKKKELKYTLSEKASFEKMKIFESRILTSKFIKLQMSGL